MPPDPLDPMFSALVGTSSAFIAVASDDGTLRYVNAAGRRFIGLDEGGSGTGPGLLIDLFAAEDSAYVREAIMTDVRRAGAWDGPFRLRDLRSQATHPVHLSMYTFRCDGDERESIALVCRDISGSQRSDLRRRLLLDAGAALSQSLDLVDTFDRLVHLVVGSFASYCVIDLFTTSAEGRTTIDRIAAAHVDWDGRAFLDVVAPFATNTDSAATPVSQAILDGESTLVRDVDDVWIDRFTTSAAHAATLKELRLRSFITVPLSAGGDIVGVFSCALAGEASPRSAMPHAYDAEDLVFIEELGRRCGAFLFNARLYARERRIADSLQSASLPRSLPQPPGIRLDADYRSSGSEATIGGDWYDAIALDDGRVAITIGDVVGHGLLAAITMTKLRQAMQSAAMIDPDPDSMLRVANKTIHLNDPDSHATGLAGILDVANGTFTFACAGHPGPLLRTADGTITEFQSGGSLLGLSDGQRFASKTFAVPPGSTLVVFTDGLVEETRDIVRGYARLHDALNDERILNAPSASRAIRDAVLEFGNARDDVAVLVVRFDAEVPARTSTSDPRAPATDARTRA